MLVVVTLATVLLMTASVFSLIFCLCFARATNAAGESVNAAVLANDATLASF